MPVFNARNPLEYLLGAGELGLSGVTNLASMVGSVPYGIYKQMESGEYGQNTDAFDKYSKQMMDAGTYQPRTAAAQDIGSLIGSLMEDAKIPPVMPELMPLAALSANPVARNAQIERAGMAAERAIEPAVIRTLEKGGANAQSLMDMVRGSMSPMDVYHGSPFNLDSLANIENKFKDVSLDLYEKDSTINLSRIVVPKEMRKSGVGTDVMQDLTSYADKTGQRVVLTPSSAFGGNVKKLKDFYKRFGFIENKGKNKDFTTMESMIRSPQPARQQEIVSAQRGLLEAVSSDASDIFGANAKKVMYKDPYSGGLMQILTRPGQPASVLGLEVPENFRNQGIAGRLQGQALKDFPNMQGQVSSKAAAKSAYKLGRRPVGKPDASIEDVFKMIDEDSSVNLVSPARQQEISGAEVGLLDADYRGSHSAPNAEFYGATLDDLTKIMPADVYSQEGKRLYGLGDRLVDSEWRIAALKTRGKPDAEIEVYRAVPKGVKDINSGDWVTTSKTYASQHGENTLDGDYEIIKKKVKAKTLSSEGYPYEFGYNQQ